MVELIKAIDAAKSGKGPKRIFIEDRLHWIPDGMGIIDRRQPFQTEIGLDAPVAVALPMAEIIDGLTFRKGELSAPAATAMMAFDSLILAKCEAAADEIRATIADFGYGQDIGLPRAEVDVRGRPDRVPARPTRDEILERTKTSHRRIRPDKNRGFKRRKVQLDSHLNAAAKEAEAICKKIGLRKDLAAVVKFAARWHDIGKAEERFQIFYDADWNPGDALLAKSTGETGNWKESRLPPGARHEALSARLVAEWLADEHWDPVSADLVVHLIASHHGHARPCIEPLVDPAFGAVSAEIENREVSVSSDFHIWDDGHPERFLMLQDEFGCYELAMLETLVKHADWVVSRKERS